MRIPNDAVEVTTSTRGVVVDGLALLQRKQYVGNQYHVLYLNKTHVMVIQPNRHTYLATTVGTVPGVPAMSMWCSYILGTLASPASSCISLSVMSSSIGMQVLEDFLATDSSLCSCADRNFNTENKMIIIYILYLLNLHSSGSG